MHIEAIWLRHVGDSVEVLFESLGKWHLAIRERADGAFSHIVEHPALVNAPVDTLVSEETKIDLVSH